MNDHLQSPEPRATWTHHQLFGAEVDAIESTQLTEFVARNAQERKRTIVANHNLHSLALLRTEPALQRFFDLAALTFIDSTWLVRFGRMAGAPLRQSHRTTYLDWLDLLLSRCQELGLKVAHVGCPEEVAHRAKVVLDTKYPGLELAVHHGYFDARKDCPESVAVLDWLAAQRPDVVLIGMGMPRQELWIADHIERLPECVILPSGACFGYIGGEQRMPPRWSGPLGLEWAFRLMAEPRRLWRRYLVEPFPVVVAIAAEIFRRRVLRRPPATPSGRR
jgi:N-acetylglucosaminyldiphosphoundecaprenol N-acetyl-beta-D-mannosaminyltransferase